MTIQEIADQAGVSTRTVHRVISDPALVDDATATRVAAVIEEKGYTGPVRRGRKPSAVPLIHPIAPRVDERTRDELARRGQVLTDLHGPRSRGWDSELVRLALDWAFNPPEGVDPMPDNYLGHVDRVSPQV